MRRGSSAPSWSHRRRQGTTRTRSAGRLAAGHEAWSRTPVGRAKRSPAESHRPRSGGAMARWSLASGRTAASSVRTSRRRGAHRHVDFDLVSPDLQFGGDGPSRSLDHSCRLRTVELEPRKFVDPSTLQIESVARGRAMRYRSTTCFDDLHSRLWHGPQCRCGPFTAASSVIDCGLQTVFTRPHRGRAVAPTEGATRLQAENTE